MILDVEIGCQLVLSSQLKKKNKTKQNKTKSSAKTAPSRNDLSRHMIYGLLLQLLNDVKNCRK